MGSFLAHMAITFHSHTKKMYLSCHFVNFETVNEFFLPLSLTAMFIGWLSASLRLLCR
jgi:hypothetical protein